MNSVYLARQPIIDVDANIFAYEILYRDMNSKSTNEDGRYTSAVVVSNVINRFGTKSLLEDKRAFIKIDAKFLLNDIVFSVPKEFFVLDILESVDIDHRISSRVKALYDQGYILSIADTKLTINTFKKYSLILKYISFFKIDFEKGLDEDIYKYIKELKKHDIQVIASKVEEHEQYDLGKRLEVDYYQGYFFAKPKILENAKYEAMQFDVLKLYNLLMQDAGVDEITAAFEKTPEITIQLLQFINSGAFHFRNKISSIHHVITLMGRVTLAKWLMLMIYSKSLSKNKNSEPLMLMIQNRIELMQLILKAVEPNVKSNRLGEAYLVAVLSLVDTIFSMKLDDILDRINISQSVKDALLYNKNIFGEILRVILYIENSNFDSVAEFEENYSLEHNTIQNLVVGAIENVNKFNHPEEE